ncbi:RNA polymerase sigma factor RpoD/SigA [bacterium]|nr:RNA polymerase sigma factor RpoD/SigA [bacterium]
MATKKRNYSEDGLQDYLRQVCDHPVLNREEEVALFQRHETGDETAREEILRCNLRFVVKIALQFKNRGLSVADLVQEGNIGLLQVIDKFDWRKGFRFSTYAAYYIRQEIQSAIHRQGSMIRLPVRKARLMGKINECTQRFLETIGREPTPKELSLDLDVPIEKIHDMLEMHHSFASLDAEPEDDGRSFSETLADENAISPSHDIEEEQTRAAVCNVLDFLNDREREVMELRYGFRNGRSYSLRKASRLVGLSQEGVRRVEHRALDKLRRPAIRQHVDGLLSA